VVSQNITVLRERLLDSCFVVYMHQRDEECVGAQDALHLRRVYEPFWSWGDDGHVEATLSERIKRFEDSLVLYCPRDYVAPSSFIAKWSESKQSDIVALGCTARKYDFIAFCVECRGNLVACDLNGALGATTVLVRSAAGIAKILIHEATDNFEHRRFDRARGIAVQVHGQVLICHRSFATLVCSQPDSSTIVCLGLRSCL
jgi:hypothetical protein